MKKAEDNTMTKRKRQKTEDNTMKKRKRQKTAIQLDLNFNFSRMNLLDKVFVESKISLTYIKSLFIQFSKVMCLFHQIICFLISMNVTGDFG
jgi:hypothetical protein